MARLLGERDALIVLASLSAVCLAMAAATLAHESGCCASSLGGVMPFAYPIVIGMLESFVQLAPLLSPVLPVHIKDNEVTKHLSGETRLSTTIRLMVMVLAAKLGSGRPVIVFEDAHWMDSSSWAVLRAALDVVKPMLVLLTLRPLPERARTRLLRSPCRGSPAPGFGARRSGLGPATGLAERAPRRSREPTPPRPIER